MGMLIGYKFFHFVRKSNPLISESLAIGAYTERDAISLEEANFFAAF
jgi:hypothetical protein